MKNQEIRQLWEQFVDKYAEYFLSNEEQWKMTLQEVIKYIDENDKRPSCQSKDINIKKFGQWIYTQKQNYQKNENIMKNQEIHQLWEQFVEKYAKHFQSNEENWKMTLKEVSKYIDENDKCPSQHDKDEKIKKLGRWIGTQKKNYQINEFIMKNPEIRLLWEQFTEKYSDYFK